MSKKLGARLAEGNHTLPCHRAIGFSGRQLWHRQGPPKIAVDREKRGRFVINNLSAIQDNHAKAC